MHAQKCDAGRDATDHVTHHETRDFGVTRWEAPDLRATEAFVANSAASNYPATPKLFRTSSPVLLTSNAMKTNTLTEGALNNTSEQVSRTVVLHQYETHDIVSVTGLG